MEMGLGPTASSRKQPPVRDLAIPVRENVTDVARPVTLSSKRRIALVSNLSPHYRRPLYEVLAQRFDLDCFFFAASEPYFNSLLPAFVAGEFTRIELRRVNLLGEPLLPGLARRLTGARYDAVIMGLTGRLMVPYVYAVARARHMSFVLWTGLWHHPGGIFHRSTRGATEALYRRSDAIIVYGDHVRRALMAVRGMDDAKIFTAAQSVDGAKFAVRSNVAASRELLFVGRFEAQKGVEDLLGAFALVTDSSARLSLVGNGSLESALRLRAASDPRVEVVGHVPHHDLPDRYAQARGLVLPSVTTTDIREAWGLVVNEAMHAGLPVIATDAVGAAAHGLVENGVTGLVVPERDPKALGAAMAQLLADDARASGLGRQARERVSLYTVEAMADAFEAAVEFAIRRRQRSERGAAL